MHPPHATPKTYPALLWRKQYLLRNMSKNLKKKKKIDRKRRLDSNFNKLSVLLMK